MAARDARNPQHAEMSDASMLRTLAAQADLVWPLEAPLFDAYGLAGRIAILDVGCGTGEITRRLAALYPEAELAGVDLIESHLELARGMSAGLGERLRYEPADATALPFADGAFDLVVCRHMLQVVPDPAAIVAELLRVAKRGGVLHLLAEDYHMLQAEPPADPAALDPDVFWLRGPVAFGRAIGTDLRIGRTLFGHLRRAGARKIDVHHLVVDTVRSDRATLAAMMEAWRDGFAGPISEETGFDLATAVAHFDAMIATIRDPDRYFAWQIPVWSARRP